MMYNIMMYNYIDKFKRFSMKTIGITGPSGSGKTLLSEYFSSLGYPIIDADALYHSMLTPPSDCLDAIRDAFGSSVFTATGELDRAALASLVFNNAEKLALLNRTVLDKVLCRIRKILKKFENDGLTLAFVDAPTLIESGFHKECDKVISVISSPDTRIKRIMERDDISQDKALERVRAQKNDEFYIDNSSLVLTNDGTPEDFLAKVQTLINTLGL